LRNNNLVEIMKTGDTVELTLGAVAHGGHVVARIPSGPAAGRVVFVRHGLPGETVTARLTDTGKLWRADVIEVLDNPSPDRVPSVWPEAGPGGVGGGELAHVSPPGSRSWKAAVLAEQMQRLAGIDISPIFSGLESVTDDEDYFAHRTRVELLAGSNGYLGMTKHRSNEVVVIDSLPFATPALQEFVKSSGLLDRTFTPGSRVTIVVPKHRSQDPSSSPIVLIDDVAEPRMDGSSGLVEHVTFGQQQYRYELSPSGFWQVHAHAPEVLVDAVSSAVGPINGVTLLELYSGAGLFTLPLATNVGRSGHMATIEGSKVAVEFAKRNVAALRDHTTLPKVTQVAGSMDRKIRELKGKQFDAIVTDPPRAGMGRAVTDQVANLGAQRIVYVACDPAALARDTGYLSAQNYELTGLRAFDVFPLTHHFETIATFTAR
jgi:tRNA/tmRNA/rRNA uracil-C5-methylase (TrmA/RlmC/RlmD family)